MTIGLDCGCRIAETELNDSGAIMRWVECRASPMKSCPHLAAGAVLTFDGFDSFQVSDGGFLEDHIFRPLLDIPDGSIKPLDTPVARLLGITEFVRD